MAAIVGPGICFNVQGANGGGGTVRIQVPMSFYPNKKILISTFLYISLISSPKIKSDISMPSLPFHPKLVTISVCFTTENAVTSILLFNTMNGVC